MDLKTSVTIGQSMRAIDVYWHMCTYGDIRSRAMICYADILEHIDYVHSHGRWLLTHFSLGLAGRSWIPATLLSPPLCRSLRFPSSSPCFLFPSPAGSVGAPIVLFSPWPSSSAFVSFLSNISTTFFAVSGSSLQRCTNTRITFLFVGTVCFMIRVRIDWASLANQEYASSRKAALLRAQGFKSSRIFFCNSVYLRSSPGVSSWTTVIQA